MIAKSCESDDVDERAQTASEMISLGSRQCEADVFHTLTHTTDEEHLRAALRVLPSYVTEARDFPQPVVDRLEQALRSGAIEVRISAASVLGGLESKTSSLEQALATSDDPVVSEELRRAIRKIRLREASKRHK